VAGRARPVLRRIHRRLLSVIARDVTERVAGRSALVVAPHPDDETIGCGATIARKRAAGARVEVVVVADGGDVAAGSSAARAAVVSRRAAECHEACRRLGVPAEAIHLLGFPDGSVAPHTAEVSARLRSIVETFQPDDVLAPCAIDAHPDHRAVAEAVDDLRQDALAEADLLAYPVWFWNRWAWLDRRSTPTRDAASLLWKPLLATFRLHARVVRTDQFAEQKRFALAAHESQVGHDERLRDGLDPDWLQTFLGRDELFFARSGRSRP
jgi:LmbE family N-acetylglucosaminyl deacetylase